MSRRERQRDILSLFQYMGYESDPLKRGRRRSEKLSELRRLSKRCTFSNFDSTHMEEAKNFCSVLLGARDFEEFKQLATDGRDILNPSLYVYGLSCAMLESPLCRDLAPPPIHEIKPDYFIPSETIGMAVKAYLDNESQDKIVVPIHETGTLQDDENRLTYFREDIGINTHHLHWHLVYPFNGEPKDRKGELFYYMHQQMCARYDCERLSVGLRLVEAWNNFGEPLQGYASHLISFINGKSHGSRPDGMRVIELNDLNRWRERIMDAIHQGYLVDPQGQHIPLDIDTGIDLLGDVVEPSNDSVNRIFYGSLHNNLHLAVANVHDPNLKFQQLQGAIGESETAVRDPVFFRLHRFVDNLFNEYKETLPPYTEQELIFPEVQMKEIRMTGIRSSTPNLVRTFMKKATLELKHALKMKISVKVEYKHMSHEPFIYDIVVSNVTCRVKEATVRIFLAPVKDDIGQDFPFAIQRRFFIELDKFHVTLKPGKNTIQRSSTESSVTVRNIPSFEDLMNEENEIQNGGRMDDRDAYCNCGWPQHMLLPRGTLEGMDFVLFAMLTNNTEDLVLKKTENRRCVGAISYCGLKDKKYPDKKAMGFPFDRRIIQTREEFMKPNMIFNNIKIKFEGEEI